MCISSASGGASPPTPPSAAPAGPDGNLPVQQWLGLAGNRGDREPLDLTHQALQALLLAATLQVSVLVGKVGIVVRGPVIARIVLILAGCGRCSGCNRCALNDIVKDINSVSVMGGKGDRVGKGTKAYIEQGSFRVACSQLGLLGIIRGYLRHFVAMNNQM